MVVILGTCYLSTEFLSYNISVVSSTVLTVWTVVSITNVLVAIPTVYINLLILSTVVGNPNLRRSISHLVLAAPSVNDFLIGLVVEPLFVALTLCNMMGCAQLCFISYAYQVMAFLCIGWSVVSFTLVSLERYFAVERPLFYNAKIKTNTGLLVKGTASVWIFSAVILVLARFGFHEVFVFRQVTVLIIVIPSLAITGFCYLRIHMTAARHVKNIAVLYNNQDSINIRLQTAKLKIIKHTFTIGLVALMFVVTFIPMIVCRGLRLVKGKEWASGDFTYISAPIWITCIHIQSVVNPMIYAMRIVYIRKGVLKRLKCSGCLCNNSVGL